MLLSASTRSCRDGPAPAVLRRWKVQRGELLARFGCIEGADAREGVVVPCCRPPAAVRAGALTSGQ